MIFRLHTVYNKYDIIKIGNKNREKSQELGPHWLMSALQY